MDTISTFWTEIGIWLYIDAFLIVVLVLAFWIPADWIWPELFKDEDNED